jgi:hypothetical protein
VVGATSPTFFFYRRLSLNSTLYSRLMFYCVFFFSFFFLLLLLLENDSISRGKERETGTKLNIDKNGIFGYSNCTCDTSYMHIIFEYCMRMVGDGGRVWYEQESRAKKFSE